MSALETIPLGKGATATGQRTAGGPGGPLPVAADLEGASLPMASAQDHWTPPGVVAACSTAVHRVGGPGLSNLGVTSCCRGEGRTTVATAVALVQRHIYGRTTILVEMDIERPSLVQRLGLEDRPGLAELIRGEASALEVIQWSDERLGVIPAGKVGETSDLIPGLAGPRLLAAIESCADVVVADLPPLPPEGLGLHVADLFAAVLLVVRGGYTPARHLQAAAATLRKPPAVVLNGTGTKTPRWARRMMGARG